MEKIYLPTLHTFAMKNVFTGSCGELRFRVAPNVVMKTAKEVDMEASTITAEFWHGPYCYQLSQMEGSKTFPMSEEGREEMQRWLESVI